VATIRFYCGCGCDINLVVKEGRIVGVEPWKEHPVDEGNNCIKGRNAFDFLYANGRLGRLLIRENGFFKGVSWEEDLALIAEKLKKVEPDSVGSIDSGKCTKRIYMYCKSSPELL
jgi:predicted molibdopterin-dependent oxidoreductase YjgC